MIRFTMPDTSLPLSEIKLSLKEQFDEFLNCEAMSSILSILNTDINNLSEKYNGRKLSNGVVREIFEFNEDCALEQYKYELYPFLIELGCFNINEPLSSNHSHIIVLGGTLVACHSRTMCTNNWTDSSTEYVDGLACYRPISPTERKNPSYPVSETEFGAMNDAFLNYFNLSENDIEDNYSGNRNLNSISNIRTFKSSTNNITYRILAAPSSQPDIRRADTADTMKFYMDNTNLDETSNVLAITNNRHRNRQFLQLVYEMLNNNMLFGLDIIGCTSDDDLYSVEKYNPYQHVQNLIGTIDWIDRFNNNIF